MEKAAILTLGGLAFLVTLIAVSLLSAIPVYFLWNWLMPALFGLPQVTFWQAIGLSFLSSFLFKSSSSSSSK